MSILPKSRACFLAGLLLGIAAAFCGLKIRNHFLFLRPLPAPVKAHPGYPAGANTLSILGIGQSNAASHGATPGAGGPSTYAFWNDSFFQPTDPWPGTSGQGGSVWSRLGPLLKKDRKGDEIVLAAIAQGSTAVHDWAPGGRCHPSLQQTLQDLKSRNLGPDWIIWHQGETDAMDENKNAATYLSELNAMISSIREAGIEAPLLVCLATRHGNHPLREDIRLAQKSSWQDKLAIYAGVDTDTFGNSYRSDGVHFNDKGLELFAEGLAMAMERKSDKAAVRLEDIP